MERIFFLKLWIIGNLYVLPIIGNPKMRRVIIDVDVGPDDALALFIFLHAEKLNQIKIEAITCANGNTDVDHACKNVVRILEILQRTDIPVFRGASRQLIPVRSYSLDFGEDGFGDLSYRREPNLDIIQKTPASIAIRNIVTKYPHEISLVALAPLTNVALAIRLYDDFLPNLKEVYVMGGSYGGIGSATPTAEYNFYIDPESAYIVLDSFKRPLNLLIWQTCLKTNLTLNWVYNVLDKSKNPAFQLLLKAERQVFPPSENKWIRCDALLAVAYLYPEQAVLNEISSLYASVELNGEITRGELVLDDLKGRESNVTIIEEINEEFYKNILLQSAGLPN